MQVPLVWAAWLLKIPVVLHQQDLLPSLANSLCQFAAKKITVSFESSQRDFASSLGLFYKKNASKIILTGNPFRQHLKEVNREEAQKFFKLKSDLPTLLVLGGGTGAAWLNNLILDSLPQLSKTVQILHSTGVGKFSKHKFKNYYPYEFISDMGKAYSVADIVLCRAGLSTITELSNLSKVSIIVPMPDSHQEVNAFFLHQHGAAIIAEQEKLDKEILISIIRRLIFEPEVQLALKKNISALMPKNAAEKIAEVILKIING